MLQPTLQEQLFDIILNRFPRRVDAVEALCHLLHLAKDPIYRRLRGDTPLLPQELALLAQHFGISLDALIIGQAAHRRKSMTQSPTALQELLDTAAARYNRPDFIAADPISIPHRFSKLQDREIMAFWAATLAWGQRKTIIQSANKLAELMDNAPYDFMLNHIEKDRARFESFKHRTFQPTDTLWFLEFLQTFYKNNDSLETAFTRHLSPKDPTVENALRGFHDNFFDHPFAPDRTRKHVATPARGSTCKRLNMFLRWMVRKDAAGVDFGLWENISPAQLLIPLDVHVERVARRLGILQRKQTDWLSVLELTGNLRAFDPIDPVRYDFALFGMGVLESPPIKSIVNPKS